MPIGEQVAPADKCERAVLSAERIRMRVALFILLCRQ
jgi:hypothetical protein